MCCKKKSAGLVLILILAIVILAVGYCYFLRIFWFSENSKSNIVRPAKQNQAVDETAGWKNYRNDQYGFEIQYPSDWIKGSDEKNLPSGYSNSPLVLYKKSTTSNYPNNIYPLDATIAISTRENPDDLSLQKLFENDYKECLNEEKKSDEGGCPGLSEIDAFKWKNGLLYIDESKWKEIVVDGRLAFYLGEQHIPDYVEVYTNSIYIQVPKKFIIISATFYNNQYSTKLSEILDEFISTFKFIDSGLINTSDWKTRHDEKYGFEYMAPADYNYFWVEAFKSAELPEGYKYLGLKEYAQKIWQLNKDDANPNITNKSLSDFAAIKIDGRDAFSFNLTGSFVWPSGGRVVEGERAFIFTANKQGTIFSIDFPANDKVSQEILKTFKINEDWITPKIAAGEWKRYSSLNGFSFEYPSNIFNAEQAKDNSVLFSSKRGSLFVKIVDKKLDPNNIEGMYGKIENPEIIKIGDNIGYKYGWGDAGCGAKIVETALAASTLQISFGSCSDDLYYLAQDNDLQGKILSTFKFIDSGSATTDWKTYRNTEYGFSLVFPESWYGYRVENGVWQGWVITSGGIATKGPELTIENTQGKKELQPIPIMIFTPEQWTMVENESIAVSAAPYGPRKIGQNFKYIFALPPRWVGFMDYARQDEAQEIAKTFKAF